MGRKRALSEVRTAADWCDEMVHLLDRYRYDRAGHGAREIVGRIQEALDEATWQLMTPAERAGRSKV